MSDPSQGATHTPVIAAIDVDGVVNALPRTEADLAHFRRWERRRVGGFTLTVAGEVVDWMTSLGSRGAEFHWATTWTPNRDLLVDAFGLPAAAPVAADPDRRKGDHELHVGRHTRRLAANWKATQILELLEAQRRSLLWLDDAAITDAAIEALEQAADRLDISVLTIEPELFSGLRPGEMALAEDFLEQVVSGSAPAGVTVRRPG